MATLDRNGARIFYEDTGGEGAALVFSHGILMDHEMFEPQVASLRGEFRCVSWDQRGHGGTESEGSFTYWDSAQDITSLLDHLDIDHAFLIGMSQGGFVSLRVALLAPERVKGLALIDTQAKGEDPELVVAYESYFAAWMEQPTAELAEMVAAILLGPADHEPWTSRWLARQKEWVREPYRALVGRDDLTDRLGEIACPALVIHGEADAAIPMDRAEDLARGLPMCDGLVRIPEAGHTPNLSHPGVVTEALRDFFRRHAV
jgi:pimeloyl-ACP methyl ester carboxylesterase